MKNHVKRIQKILMIGVILILGIWNNAIAIEYPVKPIELICPYGAGGSVSMGGRIIAGTASEFLGKPIIIINKPGAGGSIAAAYVARAKPDGYTLFICNSASNGVTLAIRSDIGYKNSDFEYFGQFSAQNLAFVVKRDAPWQTLREVVEFAKQNPGSLKYLTSGVGTSLHFGMELFKLAAGGLKIEHIPFKSGAEYNAALLGGHAHLGLLAWVDIKGLVEAGKLRVLAVPTSKRLDDLPDVPTFTELGFPEVILSMWYGIAAPVGLPKEISTKLKESFSKTFQHSEVKKMLIHIGYTPVYRDADDFTKFVNEQEKIYLKVAKEANIRVD